MSIKMQKSDFLRKKTFFTKKILAFTLLIILVFSFAYTVHISSNTKNLRKNVQTVKQEENHFRVSHNSGIYDNPFTLHIDYLTSTPKTTNASKFIRYTLDGSNPSIDSKAYIAGIEINSSSVVKFAYFVGNEQLTNVTERVFILNRHKFPVVSIVTDPKNLWDQQTGIYVGGKDKLKNYEQRGGEWVKPANLLYFDEHGNLGLDMGAEIRISGGATRAHSQKSLRVCASEKFGDNAIRYDFFNSPDNSVHRCIILRNSGNDWDRTLFRDILGQSLIYETDVDTQLYKPAVLYLNGEYWGIHNIREFYDDHYLSYKYKAKRNTLTIVEPDRANKGYPVLRDGKPGDEKSYVKLLENINDFKYIEEHIDVENYIDYFLINVFVANDDWPENNIRVWRFKSDLMEQGLFQPLDGKWRWLLFDLDSSMGLFRSSGFQFDTLSFATQEKIKGQTWPTNLIRTLLAQDKYRNMFINRYADLLNTNFDSERILDTIDFLQNHYEQEIPMHIQKWGGRKDKGGKPAFETQEKWNENIDVLREFAVQRPQYAREHVVNKFGLSGTSKISVNENDEFGYIRINTIDTKHDTQKSELVYFNDTPIEIEAIPSPGYKFVRWEGLGNQDDKTQHIILSDDIEIKPIFEKTWWRKVLDKI